MPLLLNLKSKVMWNTIQNFETDDLIREIKMRDNICFVLETGRLTTILDESKLEILQKHWDSINLDALNKIVQEL